MSVLRRAGIVASSLFTLFSTDAANALPAAPIVPPPSMLALGAVSSEVVRSDVDLGALLRTRLEEELPGVDLGRTPRPMMLNASLVRLDAEASDSKASVTCVVSAMLIDVKRGTVVAVLEGRARAENVTVLPSLERAAMSGAVRSALSRVPEAIK